MRIIMEIMNMKICENNNNNDINDGQFYFENISYQYYMNYMNKPKTDLSINKTQKNKPAVNNKIKIDINSNNNNNLMENKNIII